ncbi:MAG: CBS domain-containing protein [Actinobacteria bacterium]|nr:CBS domain-containing protein [Actinomycetota bacterium]
MVIGELLSRSVLTIGPASTLREAARAMVARRVGSAVMHNEEGHPAIITERDLMRAFAADGDLDALSVEDYMTRDAMTASPSWDIIDAAERMKEAGFRHLIVMNETGTVAGVLSMRDLVGALLDRVTDPATTGGSS